MNTQNGIPAATPKAQALVLWILWAAFLVGICVIFFVLGKGKAPTSQGFADPIGWVFAAGPLAVSAIVRWILLPKAKVLQQVLVFMILGIAMSEAVNMFGIFLVPQHKTEFFALSFLGILQFMPVYARRFTEAPESDPLRQPFQK